MEFKTEPFRHQHEAFNRLKDIYSHAIFWEQGTGKTKHIIDTASHLYLEGKIDGLLIVAPNGVHRNWWIDEIPRHMPDAAFADARGVIFTSAKAKTQALQKSLASTITHKGFAVFVFSYDSCMTEAGYKALSEIFRRRKLMYVLDESHAIKEPTTKRTKTLLRSSRLAPYRRVMTGTPVTQGPFDVYTQIQFLDETFWARNGYASFVSFRHEFGVWKKAWNPTAINPFTKKPGREYEVLVGYRNLDKLQKLIAPISSRVTKDEVLDLPPKLYQRRDVEMNPDQARMYRELKETFIATVDQEEVPSPENTVVVPLAMVRLLRLQQIACGYVATPDASEPVHVFEGPNQRLRETVEICQEAGHKVIVWARFQMDIDLILKALGEEGIRAVRYDGQVGDEGRANALALFTGRRKIVDKEGKVVSVEAVPENEQAKVFVGNPAAGGTGITLVEAKTVVYYSNSFKLNDRLQSEDRCHRIGQDNQVLYIDLVAQGTVDGHIIRSLRNKHDIASKITNDKLKEWLTS